jgi:hypothetical protein
MARTARWVEGDLNLTLRAAMVSVADIQSAGHDVRIARLGTSPAVAFVMFTSHGVEWAEAEMKQDRFAVDAAAPDAHPELTDLSCR